MRSILANGEMAKHRARGFSTMLMEMSLRGISSKIKQMDLVNISIKVDRLTKAIG